MAQGESALWELSTFAGPALYYDETWRYYATFVTVSDVLIFELKPEMIEQHAASCSNKLQCFSNCFARRKYYLGVK